MSDIFHFKGNYNLCTFPTYYFGFSSKVGIWEKFCILAIKKNPDFGLFRSFDSQNDPFVTRNDKRAWPILTSTTLSSKIALTCPVRSLHCRWASVVPDSQLVVNHVAAVNLDFGGFRNHMSLTPSSSDDSGTSSSYSERPTKLELLFCLLFPKEKIYYFRSNKKKTKVIHKLTRWSMVGYWVCLDKHLEVLWFSWLFIPQKNFPLKRTRRTNVFYCGKNFEKINILVRFTIQVYFPNIYHNRQNPLIALLLSKHFPR